MRRQHTTRPAFTLTEMMVATALILFIMAIISTAFRSGLETFSKLNMVGKQQEQLLNAQRIIQRDLAADHFDEVTPGLRGPRLSDQRLDRVRWSPPTNGYFIAWQRNGVALNELTGVTDGEGLTSTRNTECFLRFSVKLRTDSPPYDIPMYRFSKSFQFSGPTPPADRTTYSDAILDPLESPLSSRVYYITNTWGEVVYSMIQTGTTDGSVGLYSLRRTLVNMGSTPPQSSSKNVIPPPPALPPIDPNGPNPNWPNRHVADSGGPVNPRDTRCWDPRPQTPPLAGVPPQTSPLGDDILLTNVVSFELKYLWTGPTEYSGLVKMPVHPLQPGASLPTKPTDPNPIRLSSSSIDDSADWPFSDLPHDSSRTTMKEDGVTRTNQPSVAWPGVSPNRQRDLDELLYFDTWYPATSNVPDWNNPPVDDRMYTPPMSMTRVINPGATLPNQPPLRIRIKAIQFKIRIWDEKTGQTRQITFMQEV